MGIALAAVTIHTMTPCHAHWRSEDYPPIGKRLKAMIGGYNLPDHSSFGALTGCLLIALMRQDNNRLDITAASYKSAALPLLGELR